MSWLLVDIGNTRVKWATYHSGRIGATHAHAFDGWDAKAFARRVMSPKMPSQPDPDPLSRIIVSSVAGSSTQRMMIRAARLAHLPTPEFVDSRRQAAGVTTAYIEPWRLGVDRFIAAIGAHDLCGDRAVCVASVGTALTVDLVDARGLHRGGSIIPSPGLMVDSLLRGTEGIRRRTRGGAGGDKGGLFARSTRSAIHLGGLYAAASLIDRAVDEARSELPRSERTHLELVVTGGGAAAVKPLLRSRCIDVPNLVLRGLAVWGRALPEPSVTANRRRPPTPRLPRRP